MARLDIDAFARALLGHREAARADAVDIEATQPIGLRHVKDEPIWHESSFDLKQGLEMTEQPFDTLPGELRALFRRR